MLLIVFLVMDGCEPKEGQDDHDEQEISVSE